MRIVADTNVIFAALIKDSSSRKIIIHGTHEIISINFLEDEINKYKREIIKKSGISENELNSIFNKLKEKITFIDDQIVLPYIREAVKIMKDIDLKDSPFIAAALATNSDIWSDDKHFQKQNRIKIWKTKDLINP